MEITVLPEYGQKKYLILFIYLFIPKSAICNAISTVKKVILTFGAMFCI